MMYRQKLQKEAARKLGVSCTVNESTWMTVSAFLGE